MFYFKHIFSRRINFIAHKLANLKTLKTDLSWGEHFDWGVMLNDVISVSSVN